ncbi:hypothetical protein HAX54_026954, partial [Datura stramonium]|nr:hypothetical protein [Datura stramonium]
VELLMNYMKDLYIRNHHAKQGYGYSYNENKGRNDVCLAEASSQGSDDSLLFGMENTLELEDRMNELALQVAAQQVTKEKKVSPPQPNMDEETFGWEMEEEILEETFSSLFLISEEWEEERRDRRFSGRTSMQKCRCRPPPEDKVVNEILWEAIDDSPEKY